MPKFEVTIHAGTTMTVEADDRDDAERKAKERADLNCCDWWCDVEEIEG